MYEKTMRFLLAPGSVQVLHLLAAGAGFPVGGITVRHGTRIALIRKGTAGSRATLDAPDRWVRALGIDNAQLDVARSQPEQKALCLS
jgi:hypothetical protein